MLSFEILNNRNFRALLWTRGFITLAMAAQAVIIGWQIYSITKDPWMLGLTGLVEAVPALICSLFSGHIVDISRPKRVYIFAVTVLALNSFILMIAGGGHITITQDSLILVLFLGAFISGLARAFSNPAAVTLMPMIVKRAQLSSANAWISTAFQMGAITGPAIAGLIYGGYGAGAAWFMPFALLIMAVILTLPMKINQQARPAMREPAWKSIRAGWHFILRNPVVLSVMVLDMFAVLFGGAVAMLPAFADSVLHVGAQGLGALRAAPAIGSVLIGLYLAVRPLNHLSGKMLLSVFAGFGVCMIGFGLSTTFWLSMAFLIASGIFDGINMVIRGTIIQLLTPQAMMGRVSSIKSMFVISSNELGAFESGAAARLFGLVPSVVFGGVATLMVVAAVAFLSPSLRKTVIKSDHDPDAHT